jgi:hypothetical protein
MVLFDSLLFEGKPVCMKHGKLVNILNFRKWNIFGKRQLESDDEITADPFELLWNDFERRSGPHTYYSSQWINPSKRLANWEGSIDYSGYKREECLRNLISDYQLGDENRILLRLADWVPEIQSLARGWILNHFEKVPLESVIKNSELISYLERKDKLSGDPGLRKIEEVVLNKIQKLEDSPFSELDVDFRRFAYQLSLDQDQGLRSRILNDENPFLRILLLKHPSCTSLDEDETRRLERDSSLVVVREFLLFRIRNGLNVSKEELLRLALHRNFGLRDIARFYLKKNYDIDCYELYKSLKLDEFYFIADYAKKEDVDSFIRGVETGDKYIRALCVRALILTDRHQLNQLDADALLRNSRVIRKMVYENLPKVKTVDELRALKSTIVDYSPKGLYSYLSMILKKSYWHFVEESLLELSTNSSDELFHFVENAVARECRVYLPPPPESVIGILEKARFLVVQDEKRYKRLADLIEFSMGHTKAPPNGS